MVSRGLWGLGFWLTGAIVSRIWDFGFMAKRAYGRPRVLGVGFRLRVFKAKGFRPGAFGA